jgi:hypothetical protein
MPVKTRSMFERSLTGAVLSAQFSPLLMLSLGPPSHVSVTANNAGGEKQRDSGREDLRCFHGEIVMNLCLEALACTLRECAGKSPVKS